MWNNKKKREKKKQAAHEKRLNQITILLTKKSDTLKEIEKERTSVMENLIKTINVLTYGRRK